MLIKPIETAHSGYRFRSRLEARWATFFETLEEPYEYEKEGFDLGKHGWYLPDFWLPKSRLWVEIKPEIPHPSSDEFRKASALSEYQWPVCIVSLPPGEEHILLFAHDINASGAIEDVAAWFYSAKHQTLTLAVDSMAQRDDREITTADYEAIPCYNWFRDEPNDVLRLHDASVAARSARFEHRVTL